VLSFYCIEVLTGFQNYCYFVVYSFQETIDAESASEPIIDQSDEEHTLGTTNAELDSKESERLAIVGNYILHAILHFSLL
jgi:hypothetical protein